MAPLWSSVLETDKPTRLTHFSKQGLFILHMLRQAYTSPVTLYTQVNRGTHWLSPSDKFSCCGIWPLFRCFCKWKNVRLNIWTKQTLGNKHNFPALLRPWLQSNEFAVTCLLKSDKCYLSYYGLYILNVIAVLVFKFLDYFPFYFKESSLIFVTYLIQLAKHAKNTDTTSSLSLIVWNGRLKYDTHTRALPFLADDVIWSQSPTHPPAQYRASLNT